MRPAPRTTASGVSGVLAISLAACTRTPAPPTDPVALAAHWQDLAAEYEELVRGYDEATGARQISVDELRSRVARGAPIVLLDIREEHENRVSALPGALHVAPADVASAPIAAPAESLVVTYCTAGYRSGLAAVALEERLGREVVNLHGGIVAWFNAGGEVRDPNGNPVDRIDAYGPAWEKFVRPR